MLLVKEKGNIYVFQEDRWWKTTFELPRAGKVSSFKEEGKKRNLSVKDVMSYKEISY